MDFGWTLPAEETEPDTVVPWNLGTWEPGKLEVARGKQGFRPLLGSK